MSEQEKKDTLLKAQTLLEKVLAKDEQRFTREDWQMLQVARFLVSKEKFIKRDSDNRTLHYADVSSFYYLNDLNDAIYDFAKCIYDNSIGLIIDRSKVVKYDFPIGVKYKNYSEPTFDEAIIIIDMVRNAIAHGKARIDFSNATLCLYSTISYDSDGSLVRFHINSEIPISRLARLDFAKIVKMNSDNLKKIIFEAIANKSYSFRDNQAYLVLNHYGLDIRFSITMKEFLKIYYQYETKFSNEYKIINQIEEIDVSKYKNLSLNKKNYGKYFVNQPEFIDTAKSLKNIKDLDSTLAYIRNNPEKILDSDIIKRIIDLIGNEGIPVEKRMEVLSSLRKIMQEVYFDKDSKDVFESISYTLGISDEERALDVVALYNFLMQLFALYPLKEGNSLLTEFIDFSTISVDMSNTNDIELVNFYGNVEKIIKKHLMNYQSKIDQFAYPVPCLTEMLFVITELLRKLKIRNNAYLRHIRNAIDHPDLGISLNDQNVEVKDYIKNGDNVSHTFRSIISISTLINLSAAYTYIYDIHTYTEFQRFNNNQNDLLSFTFRDLFRDLAKVIPIPLLNQFVTMLNELSKVGFNREFDIDANVVDIVEDLKFTIPALGKGRGLK